VSVTRDGHGAVARPGPDPNVGRVSSSS
jgi:hypothetical protein